MLLIDLVENYILNIIIRLQQRCILVVSEDITFSKLLYKFTHSYFKLDHLIATGKIVYDNAMAKLTKRVIKLIPKSFSGFAPVLFKLVCLLQARLV